VSSSHVAEGPIQGSAACHHAHSGRPPRARRLALSLRAWALLLCAFWLAACVPSRTGARTTPSPSAVTGRPHDVPSFSPTPAVPQSPQVPVTPSRQTPRPVRMKESALNFATVGSGSVIAVVQGDRLVLLPPETHGGHDVASGNIQDLLWSPDARYLAVILDGQLSLYDSVTQRLRPVPIPGTPVDLQMWAPDGRRLLFSARSDDLEGLWYYDVEQDVARKMTTPSGTFGLWVDSSRILVITPCGTGCRNVAVVDTASGTERPLIAGEPENNVLNLALSPDRSTLAVAQANGNIMLYNVNTGTPTLVWSPHDTGGTTSTLPTTFSELSAQNGAWSPNGRYLLFRVHRPGRTQQLLVVDTRLEKPSLNLYNWQAHLWSPDGNRLLLFRPRTSSSGAPQAIHIVDVERRRLTFFAPARSLPSVTPLTWVGADAFLLTYRVSSTSWAIELFDVDGLSRWSQTFFAQEAPLFKAFPLADGGAIVLIRSRSAGTWPGILLRISPSGEAQILTGRWPTRPPSVPDVPAVPGDAHAAALEACQQPSREEALAFTLDVLDTISRHPTPSAERLAMIEPAVHALYSRPPLVPMPWLFHAWVQERVLTPLWNTAPSAPLPALPPSVTAMPVDVEGDSTLEWLVTVAPCPSSSLPPFSPYGDVFIVWPETRRYTSLLGALQERESVGNPPSSPRPLPEVVLADDLTGDGQVEIALLRRSSGATTDFERLWVLSWTSDGFQELLTTTWEPQNGGWGIIDVDGDGIAELIGEDRGPGSAAAGPFPAYQLLYKLVEGEYVPAEAVVLPPAFPPDSPERIMLLWRTATLFTRVGLWEEARAVLQGLATSPVPVSGEGVPDVRPYAMFRLGFLAGLQGDVETLRMWWRQLATTFPTHSVSGDVSQWLTDVRAPDDLGRLCGRLNEKGSNWLAEESERLWYPLELDWRDLCVPSLLFSAWEWPQNPPLDALLSRRGFRWQPVTTEYDVNADRIPDPIGTVVGPCILCEGTPGTLWAFLSADRGYRPLLITGGQPSEAIWPPQQWPPEASADQCPLSAAADLNADSVPELITICPQHIVLWAWNGHRFRPFSIPGYRLINGQFVIFEQRFRLADEASGSTLLEVSFLSPSRSFTHQYRFTGTALELVESTEEPSPEQQLIVGLELLFAARKPADALDVLEAVSAAVQTEESRVDPAVRRAIVYARALAHEYLGHRAQAAELHRRLAEETGSPWAPRARQHLERLCAQGGC